MKYKILVVDDEEDLCEILQFNLESEGYKVDVAYSAEDAMKLKLETYNLILLDVMMGGMSGFSFADKIKNKYNLKTPIIFLTAKNTENDALTGFNIGADDFIRKPFSIKILMARIKAVLQRYNEYKTDSEINEKIKIDNLLLNTEKKKVYLHDKKIDLTKKEFEILLLLVKNQGKVHSRNEIFRKIWKEDIIVSDRTIDVHMARIRKKIGEYGKMIKSRVGYGYTFEMQD
ncbi:MAG TPA: response regulator transcription factor [Bacteroidetes bacterium]|nr:response regulator transcription factor [Bacteroidota bacterium]